MKRSLRVIGLAALVAMPAMASAQTVRPVTFGVSGGLSLPMGDLSDRFESGYNITGHIGFKPAAWSNLSLRGDVSFDQFDAKATENVNYRALGFTGNAIYAFPQTNPSVVRPYVLGGVGLYNNKVSATAGNNEASTSSSDLGLQAGAGVNFQLSGFATFVEAKFVNVFGDNDSSNFIPITFGIRF